ncbi:LuxR family ATP-dependent transcriptional regulator [Cupriavidus basilensis OR16]|uniref:LuxR family ATP-dependent transcriptional regulator n=1 Tax=Cupriavidus basilensis OR16 TaxID=1127483 RepID=H1S439_9BURK|nr:LuxR C-terminal-related transcriptional regulator [Cupriavidus basilensis]EHP42678.1 LuxR family ATP-dependent transcriptional regulator [Cupriavidus basilensis OR16]
MAQQQARGRRSAETSAAVLVEAKLAPPQLSSRLLARPQLSSLLHAGLAQRLLSVTAPAGYGKTTALAQFVAQLEPLGITTAWLSLDAEDNDPLRFMRYLAAALHHADARLGRNTLAQADGGNMASLDALVTSLLHDLLGHDRRLMLVLDDFHLVQHEGLHRKLEWLIAHLPPNIGLVLASRTRLPLSVSQLRLRGELLELDAAHFGLGLDEAADFVGRVSGTPLDRAQQSRNLFLSGLDRSRTWFRYHHLFADYLRGRARELPGDAMRAVHLRASDWFHRHKLPHEAVRHAFEAHDLERAADLVASFSGELVQHRGEHATLLGWLTRLPQALVHARPKIRTGHAWSLVLTRRYPEAEQELRALEAACSDSGAVDDEGALRSVIEMIRCVYWAHTGEPLLAKSRSEAWLRSWPHADSFLTGVVANVLASGCCESDAFEQGIQALAVARRAFEECRADYGLAWASALAMMIAMRRGDQHEAMAQAKAGIAIVVRSLGVASYAGSMLTLLAAEVCYEQNDLAQAQRFIDQGLPFIDEHGLVEMTTAGYLTRARLLRLRGEHTAADACLLEGESLGHRLKLPRLSLILAAERCTLRLQAGAPDDALKLAQSYGLVARGADTAPLLAAADEDIVCLMRLRLRFAQGAGPGPGPFGALNDAIRRAQRDGHQGQLARLLALKAVQQHRTGDRAQALRTLDEALQLAAQLGLLRSLLDADALLLVMVETMAAGRDELEGATDTRVPLGYLQQLLQAAGRSVAGVRSAPPTPAGTMELTERELKILRLLKAGLGNRELAQSLFVSEATVKWHLHNIFAKLGVRNRTSALARAQENSLL